MGQRERLTAVRLRDMLVDDGTWESWDTVIARPAETSDGEDRAYADDLARARQRAGTDEAVITGAGMIGGNRAAIVLSLSLIHI